MPGQVEAHNGGERFNSETEAGYTPIEGELLGIASALHKSRYFTSGHPNLSIITDHKPICNLLNDGTRQINNKRLSNLRRKCDGYIFKTFYARGIDNTTDAILRINNWESKDEDRFQTEEDNRDSDDNSLLIEEEKKVKKETWETISLFKSKIGNKNKLEILEIMSTNWNTTL